MWSAQPPPLSKAGCPPNSPITCEPAVNRQQFAERDSMRAIVTAALLTSMLLPASAQVVTESETPTGPLILQLQPGTRAPSMGGTYMITAPDADGIFYNPQLLSAARGFSVSTQRFGSVATLATFAAALDANVGFGVQLLDYELPMFHTAESIGSPAALSRGGGL